jgi:hypothetical protein
LDFPAAKKCRGIRPLDLLRELADDYRARSIDQPLQLFEMLTDVSARCPPVAVAIPTALEGSSDEQCALDARRQIDQFASDTESLVPNP